MLIVKYMKCVSRLWVVVFYVAHMFLIAEVEAAAGFTDTLLGKQKASAHHPQRRHLAPYPRTINLTKIQFTDEEQGILTNGNRYYI